MNGISLLFAVALYFLPTIIAAARKKSNTTAIGLVNLFTGWTVIGWFFCLIWSVMNAAPASAATQTVIVQNAIGAPFPTQPGAAVQTAQVPGSIVEEQH